MSWKSFVTAGLLCVLASPAFAAPTVTVSPGGTFANNHLNANGDWVWNVYLAPTSPLVDIDDGGPIVAGSPLAAELGFQENSSEVLGAINLSTGPNDDFDDDNPGAKITGWDWLTLTDLGGDGECGTPSSGNCPVGLQFSTAQDQIFAALGSIDFQTTGNKDFIQITIQGPSTAGVLETDLQMLGAYGGNGRIAELVDGGGPPISANYDTYAGTFSRQALGGDTDLNGTVNFDDFQNLLGSYNGAGQWYNGDFNNSGTVDFNDFQDLLGNYNATYNVNSGAGSGGSGGVPEPTSALLMVIAGTFLAAWRARS